METRANYALIGAFTLAVIGAGFMFVFWFSGNAQTSARKTYEIIFTGSVSGLSRGSSVLFNGLKVGEVTQIDLMQEDPSRVSALVAIYERTPVKEDTRARLEFQGLTGVASIAFTGGSADSPEVKAGPRGQPARIYAERSDFQNLLESVQRLTTRADSIMERADRLLADNSQPINDTVRNVQSFSRALADNSEGINAFLKGMGDLGKTIGPLAAKLEVLAGDVDKVVKAVDPAQVREVVASVNTFMKTLAGNEQNINTVLAKTADLAQRLGASAGKLDNVLDLASGALTSFDGAKIATIVDDAQRFMQTLDQNRASVDKVLKDAAEISAKLNKSADKIDGVLTAAEGFLGQGQNGGMMNDVAEAARSIRKLADNLDLRTREITAGITRFTGPTAREYEALAGDARKAVNELNRTVRSIERNPQQFLFGGRPSIPEYNPR